QRRRGTLLGRRSRSVVVALFVLTGLAGLQAERDAHVLRQTALVHAPGSAEVLAFVAVGEVIVHVAVPLEFDVTGETGGVLRLIRVPDVLAVAFPRGGIVHVNRQIEDGCAVCGEV